MLVAEGSRETAENPDPELDVRVAERGQPFFEQRHEPIVVAGPHPDDPSAVTRGRAGKLARQTEASRDAGGID